jgi:transposase
MSLISKSARVLANDRLLRSLLLQIFYSVRSERHADRTTAVYPLFRWSVEMEMDEAVWNHAVYSSSGRTEVRFACKLHCI